MADFTTGNDQRVTLANGKRCLQRLWKRLTTTTNPRVSATSFEYESNTYPTAITCQSHWSCQKHDYPLPINQCCQFSPEIDWPTQQSTLTPKCNHPQKIQMRHTNRRAPSSSWNFFKKRIGAAAPRTNGPSDGTVHSTAILDIILAVVVQDTFICSFRALGARPTGIALSDPAMREFGSNRHPHRVFPPTNRVSM